MTTQRQYKLYRIDDDGNFMRCTGWMDDDSRLQVGTILTLKAEGVDPGLIWEIEWRSEMTRKRPLRRRVWDIDI
jgi:hypothetical protein